MSREFSSLCYFVSDTSFEVNIRDWSNTRSETQTRAPNITIEFYFVIMEVCSPKALTNGIKFLSSYPTVNSKL